MRGLIATDFVEGRTMSRHRQPRISTLAKAMAGRPRRLAPSDTPTGEARRGAPRGRL